MWYIAILHQILFTALCFTQPTDSSSIVAPVTDPLKSRLFLMPTGQLMDEGKFSITDIDFYLLHFGYSPFSFLQVNFTGLISLTFGKEDNDVNLSFGTKYQILKPIGLLKGIALGVDIGYFGKQRQYSFDFEEDYRSYKYYDGLFDDVVNKSMIRTSPFVTSTNIAASFGTNDLQTHVNIGQLYFEHPTEQGVDDFLPFPSYLQFGIAYDLGETSRKVHIKFIIETYITNLHYNKTYEGDFIFTGCRFYGKKAVVDIAFPISLGYERQPPFAYIGFNFFI